jgi:hypothetical protein
MSSFALTSFYAAEPLLMAAALFALVRSKERKRFPALFTYFVLRLTSFVVLEGLLHVRRFTDLSQTAAYKCYFYCYWTTYIIGAIVVFWVIQEMFNLATEPLPGLKRLGVIAFRWVMGISLLGALSAILAPPVPGYRLVVAACDQLMRCQSIFVLCLLLFLLVAAGKLGISYRSRVFGVSFGFGIMAGSNLVVSALLLGSGRNVLASTSSIIDTSASLLTLLVWTAYFVQKEPARRAVALPVDSPLVRWNEIALALGHSGGRVAVASPASDFFLQDVEQVVDRILTKNSLNIAS